MLDNMAAPIPWKNRWAALLFDGTMHPPPPNVLIFFIRHGKIAGRNHGRPKKEKIEKAAFGTE